MAGEWKKLATPHSSFKRSGVLPVAGVALLCMASYLLALWQHSSGSTPTSTSTLLSLSCIPSPSSSSSSSSSSRSPSLRKLDFTAHHAADDTAMTLPEAKQLPACDPKYSEYTPCEDRDRSLKFDRDRLIYRERHCPAKNEILKCLIPAPAGYRNPFPWPASRGTAWFANVPHKELSVEKAVQNWIHVDGDKFRFPGGGTMFPRGADAYIDDIAKLVPLKDGTIRTVVDTGCGVASFGAYLLSRDVLTMSFAPRDSHEAQVQFALERGVPAMIGVLASKRLPYPARAFDMAHCSRCLIPWQLYDGLFLKEIDRILRPGGYWVLSGPPINWKQYWRGWQRTQDDLNAEQTAIESIARSLCWKKIKEKGDIAVWRKPTTHRRCTAAAAAICPSSNPDAAWYTAMDSCVTPLPTSPTPLQPWPARLHAIPPRITAGTITGTTPEIFTSDSELWKKRVTYYKTINSQLGSKGRYRNLLDMNAKLGGFAAAMIGDPVWVMNVVPTVAEVDTLGVVYERGLIGTYQDWCEAMSTYPRTYDLLHADGIFALYRDRCEMEDILLEMDRILRPEGSVIIRDDVDLLVKIKSITDGMRWDSQIIDHEDGPLQREKILLVVKTYWTSSSTDNNGEDA